ncbi:MAG: acetylglutamate kinase [Polyangiaceae bacterium]
MMPDTQDIIVRLLRNLGTRKEVEEYLKQYSSVDSQRFAIIKVGGAVLDADLDSLASSLSFLHRVGLYPIVVHGAAPQLTQELKKLGIESEMRDGLRVTTPEILDVARRVFQRENLRLVDALESMRTHARPINTGVFEAEPIDSSKYGLVGQVTKIHLGQIHSSLRAGQLPIIACLGETAGGQILNVNADMAARELASFIQPHKIIFLTSTGGMLDAEGGMISAINLDEEYEHLMAQPWLRDGMRQTLEHIKHLLDKLPPWSSVSITSPDHLAKELFTHRGSGTLIRRGERVVRHDTFAPIDRERMRQLLEACFGRSLDPHYFDKKDAYRIYLTESYRATAILTREGDIPYLDKFAVTQQAQGVGVGSTIWLRMKHENPRLFWRSRRDNPINAWYFDQSQGSRYKSDRWTVFWYGLSSFAEAQSCIDRALALAPTFSDQPLVHP